MTWLDKLSSAFTRAMDAALHRALVLLRPDLVDFLINNGANVENYGCDQKLLKAFRTCNFNALAGEEGDASLKPEACWLAFGEAARISGPLLNAVPAVCGEGRVPAQ
eukprot:3474234-Rhodomonas_salina.1